MGKYAEEQFIKAMENDDDLAHKMCVIPAIINMAFACELYLKSFFPEKKVDIFYISYFKRFRKL